MRSRSFLLLIGFLFSGFVTWAQCTSNDIMEPGFQFLSSSRGCAPFNVQIETLYLAATPGTVYYVNWGDGTPEQSYVQANATGVVISHVYPNSPVDCGYDVVIDTENACNPRGSVVPINTQVVVWTNDIVAITPAEFRVCQGFAASLNFTDNSDWNCNPRATRENNAARWLQWIYGTGVPADQIPGIQVNGISPGGFPYLDPAANRNPRYPVSATGAQSLAINVPVTVPADVGREFQVTMKNWNQCNAYDNNLANGPQNPADLVNGDNPPQIAFARIVIVESPQPSFITRLGNSAGPVQSVFCLGDNIFFDDLTPAIAGASFGYTWEFFDNPTGTGSPVATRTQAQPTFAYPSTGQKLVRLHVHDNNAAGNCEEIFDAVITISPSLIAKIAVTDLSGNAITPDFCQENSAPFSTFNARFSDVSIGTATASTEWRWEFYDENNALVLQTGFATSAGGPFDRAFVNPGIYRVRLRIRDNITLCETEDEVQVRVFRKPIPDFVANSVCETFQTAFSDLSKLRAVGGQQIALREWDLDYDGVTFSKDATLDNQTNFNHVFPATGSYRVALRVTTDLGGCSSIIEHTVVVAPLPNASFTANRLSGCSVLQVNFSNTSATGQPDVINEFRWEIDDGSGFQVDSIQRPGDPGFTSSFVKDFKNVTSINKTFDVRLRAVTANGCERLTAPQTITVFPGPQSGFVSVNYSPFNNNCSPVSVNFSVDAATQAQNPSDYLWTIRDGADVIVQQSTGTTPAFTHNFVNTSQSIKDFEISLRATLPTGCFGDSVRLIRINPVPSSTFDIDTLAYECGRVVFHFAASQRGLARYEWTITSNGVTLFNSITAGDNFDYEITRSTSVDQNIQVNLQTMNFANCVSTVTNQSVIVPKTTVIIADFSVTPLTQRFPSATVSIINNTTTGSFIYAWDFGDGTSSASNSSSLSHTYSSDGIFTVNLAVSNGDCSDSHTVTINITSATPVLDFTYDPSSGCLPLKVNFTNHSQYTDPATYAWDFGDGEGISSLVNPSYTYSKAGVYSVMLRGKNSVGETAQVTKPLIITVFDKPLAQFEVKPNQVEFPGGKIYTDNRSFGATSFEWDFGDGGTSTDFEPVHEVLAEGTLDIQLIASNAEGCSDTTKLTAGVRTIRSGQILVPNAFSPNLSGPGSSGGKNDVFRPIMRGVSDYQLMVFSRWGQLLYETKDPQAGWDGYFNGRLCQQDVYVYKILATYDTGEKINKVGDIHLIR